MHNKQPQTIHNNRHQPPTVPGKWLLKAILLAVAAAAVCGWLTLCLLYWQGAWQLLYHPAQAIARTPASVSLPYEPAAFAATEAGQPRLSGWWIPAGPGARYPATTVLYLHGQAGNLGDSVDALATLHAVGVNVLAFDYRGYGQSQPVHPSEKNWLQDVDWALAYLTTTRHIPPSAIFLDGRELGADLALEAAVAHPELAGVVLESLVASPVNALFGDPRARLVPARLLLRDRFDTARAAAQLRIPSLWLIGPASASHVGYESVRGLKMQVSLAPSAHAREELIDAYARWLDELKAK
jgi:pimeloyl-ACP methyl ester carboxylesterase